MKKLLLFALLILFIAPSAFAYYSYGYPGQSNYGYSNQESSTYARNYERVNYQETETGSRHRTGCGYYYYDCGYSETTSRSRNFAFESQNEYESRNSYTNSYSQPYYNYPQYSYPYSSYKPYGYSNYKYYSYPSGYNSYYKPYNNYQYY
ncbi:hypothetical protein COV18_03505 [Candidatus Woesearchaeota archaeon CG10_big_fil_rev_8_21_14_0_10_37_12]|nr:MAG: hypothetical protein COV18_03505 [Candidatus Woesearchaeota archaeon CG10_big_fil_rev_8_21_14_0_10_37_12]